MWIKQSNKWALKNFNPDVITINGTNKLYNLFDTSSVDNKAVVHIPTYNKSNPLEEYNINSLEHANSDKYGFWYPCSFDANDSLDYFGDYYYVHLASTDNTKYLNSNTKVSVDYIPDVTARIDNLVIDGISVKPGHTVLLKNQAVLHRKLYDIIDTNLNYISVESDGKSNKHFNQGNKMLFFDANGTLLGSTVASKVLLNGDNLNVYLIGDVPTGAAYVADSVNGEWTLDDRSYSNGIYLYNGTTLEPQHNFNGEGQLVWAQYGETNLDAQFRLIRKEDKTYPSNSVDYKHYEKSNATVMAYKLSYAIKSKPYRFMALDYTTASKIKGVQYFKTTVQNTRSLKTDNEIIIEPVRGYIDHALDTVLKDKYGISNGKIIFKGVTGTDKHTLTFTDANNLFKFDQAFKGIDFSSLGADYKLNLDKGDFLHIEIDKGGDEVLSETFLARDIIGGTKVDIYPAFNEDLHRSLHDGTPYTVKLRVINKVNDLYDLISVIKKTFIGKFYSHGNFDPDPASHAITITAVEDPKNRYYDFSTNIYFKSSQVSSKVLVNTISMEDENGFGVNHMFSSHFNTLPADVAAIFVPSYELTSIKSRDKSISTADNANKFRIDGDYITFGADHKHLYDEFRTGLYIEVYHKTNLIDVDPAGTPDLKSGVYIVEAGKSGAYYYLKLNKRYPAVFVTGDDVTLRGRGRISEIDIDLAKSYEAGGRSQDAYAAAIAKDTNIRKHFSGVLFLDDKSKLKVILNYDELAAKDKNLYFQPYQYQRVGSDRKLSTSYPYEQSGKKGDDVEYVGTSTIRFLDGLTEANILDPEHYQNKFAWILSKSVTTLDAVIGCTKINDEGETELGMGDLVWYSGTWVNGVWKGTPESVWVSGEWRKGTWENGSFLNRYWEDDGAIGTIKSVNYSEETPGSVWVSGTWKNGTFGTNALWLNGTWRDGSFADATWMNGYWTTGTWAGGLWKDGIWSNGTWEHGHFEKGKWYDGRFGTSSGAMSTFGGNSTVINTDDSTDIGRAHWYGGMWVSGIFKVGPAAKDGNWTNHSASIWWSGTWENGVFEGGTMVHAIWNNGTWRDGIWLGGYRIKKVEDVDGASAKITLQLNHYTDALSVTGAASVSHNIAVGNQLTFIGVVEDESNQFYKNFIIQDSSYTTKQVLSTSGPDVIVVSANTAGLSGVEWTTPSESPMRPDGGPYVASVWINGTFKKGTWVNGVWHNGIWQGGSWIAGYMGNSTFM
jgi:hypothetical protein